MALARLAEACLAYSDTRAAECRAAGSRRFPTCCVPADRCDLDHHHDPWPQGVTSGHHLIRAAGDTTGERHWPPDPVAPLPVRA